MAKARSKSAGGRKTSGLDAKIKNTSKNHDAEQEYVLTEKDIRLRNEIKLLLTLAVSILIMLCNFGIISSAPGGYVRYFMFGIMGYLAYPMPFIFFLGTAFFISNLSGTRSKRASVKFAAGTVLALLICGFIQLIMYNEEMNILGHYNWCGSNGTGGGIVGAAIAWGLYNLLDKVGAYIVLILLMIITLIIITERSFIGGVKSGGKKVYDTAMEDMARLRDNAKERAAERAAAENRRKEEQRPEYGHRRGKIRGVALVKVGDENDKISDMREITDDVSANIPDDAVRNVFRGHVDVEELIDYPDSEDTYRAAVIRDDNDESKPVFRKYAVEAEDRDDSLNDDEFDFTPKERTEVSKEAAAVMKRKAFEVEPKRTDAEGETKIESKLPAIKKKTGEYKLPGMSLLSKGSTNKKVMSDALLKQTANRLKQILHEFGVNVSINEYSRGPSVTRYELQPETGTRLSKITSLADDIKLNLAATDIRIEAPIPGKSAVGIEVPNDSRETVYLRELVESKELASNPSMLAFAAGKDISGKVIVADIAKMPHMLIAGTTGSGKSVFTNSIIMTILFRAKPSDVRLIIIDPKVVEFGVYNGIPHLLQPVVTDPKLASNTLKWAVSEMSDRYKRFADLNVRDLKGYNAKVVSADEDGIGPLPQILIVIDELADLMMAAAKEVEESICRLAQLARAAGIHLIIATQRPSVDVVTGLIKANIPSRAALMVSSGVDSRTIIDSVGAEKLLGNGDMLFYPSGYVKPLRLQGAFVSDGEVSDVVDFWKSQAESANYDSSIAEYVSAVPQTAADLRDTPDGRDEYFAEAGRLIIDKDKASISSLQRVFKIGFNRAARIIDQLAAEGVISEEDGTKPRNVIMSKEEFEELLGQKK